MVLNKGIRHAIIWIAREVVLWLIKTKSNGCWDGSNSVFNIRFVSSMYIKICLQTGCFSIGGKRYSCLYYLRFDWIGRPLQMVSLRIIHKRAFTSPIHSVSSDKECSHRSWLHLTIVSRMKRCKHEPLDAASWVIIPFNFPVATVTSEWPSYNALYPLGHLDDAWWWWTVSGTVGTSQTAQRLTWSYSDDDDLLNLFIY